MFQFATNRVYPPVVRLQVHLPGLFQVYFDPTRNVEPAIYRASRSTLTEWFCANRQYPDARDLLYSDSPSRFTRNTTTKQWLRRSRFFDRTIGRMYIVHPTAGEQFYLRALLTDIPGATPFQALRATRDGVLCNTFREAAALRGGFRGGSDS